MTAPAMTSLERVQATLGHKEPDRVPFLLAATMHGAKELGLSIKSYFSKADNVVEGQLRLRKKYGHDGLSNAFYGSLEIEAWGGEVVFRDDGPPNSGEPFIKNPESIETLQPPRIKDVPCLNKVLDATAKMKNAVGDDVPIMALAISPFSVPVMQLGFDKYLELMYERPHLFWRLMEMNEEFCVEWANAQLEAGATAVVYFDPVSSPTVIPRRKYLMTGFVIAKRTLPRIKGATGIHLASGRCLPIVDDVAQTGTSIISASALEDLAQMKAACRGRLTVVGNLNGIEMRRWTAAEAETEVKKAIAAAGRGGGFVLADNHGEIPWQVPDETLLAISDAVRRWGRYPLDWID